ncbi:MAG TPA: ABC transporter permease [Thermoanaerobaculia bacterium]|nr:ABC transporter permease [Thermoanaerobaculia bacterium]
MTVRGARERLASLKAVLSPLWRRRRAEVELDEELAFHLEMETARHLERGLGPEEARRQARLSFGAALAVKEGCRDQRLIYPFETFAEDLRYGVRSLAGRPGLSLAAILTLALGLGANGSIASAVKGVLLAPLPFEEGSRLVALRQNAGNVGASDIGFSVPEIGDLRERNRSLEGLAEIHVMNFNLLGRGEPLRVRTAVVSASWFDLLGLDPLHGRTFLAADETPGAEPVLVLSHGFWQRLGGDPGLVGTTFEMNDRVHTVIGVLPSIPQYPSESDVYMPTAACPFRSSPGTVAGRGQRGYDLLGRLRAGWTPERAAADLTGVVRGLVPEHPDAYPGGALPEVAVTQVFDELTSEARPTLLLLWATVALVLVAAAANVASLTLARVLARGDEIALRLALGAGRRRIARQLVIESLLLALVGGLVGVVLAAGGSELLVGILGRFTARAAEVRLDAWVLAWIVALSVATGLGIGGLTAAQALRGLDTGARRRFGPSLHRKRGRQGLRSGLVVAQVALSVVLLIGTGLLVRSLIRLQRVDPGFDPRDVLAARIDLDWAEHGTVDRIREFYGRLLDRLRVLPGVESVALASEIPLQSLTLGRGAFELEGRPVPPGQPLPRTEVRIASAGYFETLRIPLVEGRAFDAGDTAQALPVAVVNRSLARRHGDSASLVGRRMSFDQGNTWLTVVGVVGDVKQSGLAGEIRDEVYLAFPQRAGFLSQVLVKSQVDPALLGKQLRREVLALDPEQPVSELRTLAEVRQDSIASPRQITLLLSLFAALGLTLSATGLSGLLAFFVGERRHEIGVRMALGAARESVLALVMRRGLGLVALGLTLGLGIGLAVCATLGPGLSGFLFEVAPTDPGTFAMGSLVILLVAAAACWLPARQASGVDPMTALRTE